MKLGWMLLTTSALAATVGLPGVAHATLFEGPGAINTFLDSSGEAHTIYAAHTSQDPAGCYDITDYDIANATLSLPIAQWCALSAVAGFGSSDGHNHVLVAGSTTQILGSYDWTTGTGSVAISSFALPSTSTYGFATHLAGFQSADLENHVVVSTTLGYIFDYRWSGSNVTTGTWPELTIPTYTHGAVLDVTAFEDSGVENLVYATANYMHSVAYTNTYSGYQYTNSISTPSVTAVEAFYDTAAGKYDYMFATNDTSNDICTFQESRQTGALTSPVCVGHPGQFFDVSGYYSPACSPPDVFYGSTVSNIDGLSIGGVYGPF